MQTKMSHREESGTESLFNKVTTGNMVKPILFGMATNNKGNFEFDNKNVPESTIFINAQSQSKRRRIKNGVAELKKETNLTGSDNFTKEKIHENFANVLASQSQPKMATLRFDLISETEETIKRHLSESEHRQRLERMRLEEERMHKEIETEAEFEQSEEGKELAKRRRLQEEKRHEERRRRLQEEEEEREKRRIQQTLNERQWLESINWKCALETPQSKSSNRNFHKF